MELDERINNGKKPLTCLEAEYAMQFIGKECYFSDFASKYENLKDIEKATNSINYRKDVLTYVNAGGQECAFTDSKKNNFRYCLPCEWVKKEAEEPKYRPYTLKEFIGDVNLGDPWIRMRPVGTKKECKFLYTGYLYTSAGEYICLGCFQFDLISLFKNYEICVNGEWQPFGVIEDKE